ncbi:DUF2523 family protein [Ensifer sp. 2YAB10]
MSYAYPHSRQSPLSSKLALPLIQGRLISKFLDLPNPVFVPFGCAPDADGCPLRFYRQDRLDTALHDLHLFFALGCIQFAFDGVDPAIEVLANLANHAFDQVQSAVVGILREFGSHRSTAQIRHRDRPGLLD